ncbi:HNH endonuclease [Nocardia sp. NPDC056100]|uniref:HNH endonuclease n=1 Tax=Nocardia sp. NPDC056100 TaxID=3345712 RepID=UPI0035E33FE5
MLTREAVLAAIAECDQVGRSAFLARYGLKSAREYFLLYNGRAYDTKAIVGVAHSLVAESRVRPPGAPSGIVAASRLRGLGFEVSAKMEWRTEELILACDLLYQNNWREIPLWESFGLVKPLSRLLRSQWAYSSSIPEYRDSQRISEKLVHLRSAYFDPPSAIPRGRERTVQVSVAFAENPEGMHALAGKLWSDLQLDLRIHDEIDGGLDNVLDSEMMSADVLIASVEGEATHRRIRVYERDPKLRRRKIDRSRDLRGNIACEACGFDFETAYPEIGEGYIHVHHAVPLHITGRVETTLDDLVLLCANCHQMIHRPAKWLTVNELRAIVASTVYTTLSTSRAP